MNSLRLTSIILVLMTMILVGCQGSGQSSQKSNTPVEETADEVSSSMVMDFFTDFQRQNEDWAKTTQGHKKLVEAFEEKMTSDIDFAKACATYNMRSQYGSNSLRRSESISSYDRSDGEEGEIKAFDIVVEIPLVKPLYNGQKTVSVKYEIISTIPSTIEEHWRPYVDNANYCSTFNSYLESDYDGTLNLGCFIVTKNNKQ